MNHLPFDSELLARKIDTWHAAHPGMGLLALVPEAEKDRVPLLQQICRGRGIALSGALFPALVASGGFTCQGVWLLPLETGTPSVLIPDIDADAEHTAMRIAEAVGRG